MSFAVAVKTDQLVEEIRRLSSGKEYKELVSSLKTHEKTWAQLDCTGLDAIIDSLNYEEHSLGVLAALVGKLNHEGVQNSDWSILLHQVRAFTSSFTRDQVHLYPTAFCNLIHRFTELLCLQHKALEGICVVQTAIERYQSGPTCLTAIHCDLIQLCLVAKCLKPALRFLGIDYSELLTEDDQFDPKYVLLFYYYGGMVYTCLHDYSRALLFLTVCLSTPSVAISAIMVAAYKKFVLVSLLKFAKVVSLPRYCTHMVERAIKPLCGAYTDVARAYGSGKVDVIQQLVNKYTETFSRDRNLGLVQRLETSVRCNSVQRLTHTFMTLGLADVSARVGLRSVAEAEKYIRDMIEDGEIHASLNQAKQMVSFTENPENYDSLAMVEYIDEQIAECMTLERKLSALDRDLAVDPRYVHRSATAGETDPFLYDEAVM